MDADQDHLRLLEIFHYVVGGLACLFSLFPLLYSFMGGFFVFASHQASNKPGNEPPPEFLGWIFVGLGLFGFLLGLTAAILILMGGRSLKQRRRYTFALVIACMECMFMPFGTILGIFTIIVLSRPSVKALFATNDAVSSPTTTA